jgi:antitoxin component YwqK of YwqJK toxin-antitoxin module
MSELFDQNCERWSLFHREQAKALPKIASPKVVMQNNANGMANLKTFVSDQEYFYHSQDNPEEEAKQWFQSLELRGIQILFIYGVGLGYIYDYAKNWLREDEGRFLVFLDDDLEVIYHLLHTSRGSEILNDKQVWLAFLDQGGTILNVLVANFVMKPYKLIESKLYGQIRQQVFNELKSKISFYMNLKMATTMEYSGYGRSFFTNFFHNLLRLPQATLGPHLFGKFNGVPAIICGAGPSLAKNLPLLTTLRDRALIFAGGTAINALNTGGLLPHFGVGIDPNPAQFTRLIMNNAFETPYFYRNRLFYQGLKLVHGKHLYINGNAGYKISDWFEEKLGIKQPTDIEEGCNVVNFSLSIAHEMGCDPIILVGVDLAYTNEKSYAPGILNHPIHNRKEYFGTKSAEEDVIVRLDISGQPTFTLWKWVAESLWFTNFSRLHRKKTFINSTEGGIGFASIPNIPLMEVADIYLNQQFDFEGMVHQFIGQSEMPSQVDKKRIEVLMREFLQSLERCETLCHTIQKDFEETERKLRSDIEAPPLSEEGLQALAQLETESAYTHLLEVFSQNFLQLHHREQEKLKFEMAQLGVKQIEIKKAQLNGARYASLRITANVNKKILEIVLLEETELQMVSEEKEKYSFENGVIQLLDPELGLNLQEPFTPNPETDILRQYDTNGQLLSEQFYKEGKLHGPSSYFSSQGTLLSRHWFIHGKREGKACFYTPEGNLVSIQTYRDGLLDGNQKSFYPTGNLKSLLQYKSGQLHGDVYLYYPDGALKRELHFEEGKRHGFERLWNEVGLLTIEAEFEQDKPKGIARQWYANGNLALETFYDEESQSYVVREWDESGFPSLTEKRVTGDYFDQVALQTSKLTDALNEVLSQVDTLVPLVDAMTPEQPEASPVQKEVEGIKKEFENLKRISRELIRESGYGATQEEELFWKGPTARREVEQKVQDMAQEMSKDINAIQNSLVVTLGALAKKLKKESEKKKGADGQ